MLHMPGFDSISQKHRMLVSRQVVDYASTITFATHIYLDFKDHVIESSF